MRLYLIPRIASGTMALLAVVVLLAGCAPQAAQPAPTQAPNVAGATPGAVPTSAAPAAAAAPTRAAGGEPTSSGQRMSGIVKSISGNTITLGDGSTLTLGPDTQVI